VAIFKQLVVTNCSKERLGSIVNENLKNGILILIDTSKESDFSATFKYVSFITDEFFTVLKSSFDKKGRILV